MPKSMDPIMAFLLDWCLPLPPKPQGFLNQHQGSTDEETVVLWRTVWFWVCCLAVLLGWIPYSVDPGEWLTYLNYFVSGIAAATALILLPLCEPLPYETYKHGLVPSLTFAPSAAVITWLAAAINPERCLKLVPKLGDTLASFCQSVHVTGLQTGYRAPIVVTAIALMNTCLAITAFVIQRRVSRTA